MGHTILVLFKYFRTEAISGLKMRSNNKHHKCQVCLEDLHLVAFLEMASPRKREAFPSRKGLSPASMGCCSWCPQREGAEACCPGHRKGWKQLSAPSVSLIKKQHVPRARSPRYFLTSGLGCPVHLLTTRILFSALIKSTGLCPGIVSLCSSGVRAEWESAFLISTPGDSEKLGAQATL